MNKPLCRGPFFLLIPIFLGGVVACFVARSLHPIFGVLAWYWFLVLCVACCVFSMLLIGGVGYLIESWSARYRSKHGEQNSDEHKKH